MTLDEEKRQLRIAVQKKAQTLLRDYVERGNARIAGHVMECEKFARAKTIFCFVGMPQEIDTVPILLRAMKNGKRVGVPLCTGKGIMEVREIHSLTDLHSGAYGIWEPNGDCPKIERGELELGLIPCVSCNRQGQRLGHGCGYYDRYLAGTAFPKLVLCYEALLTPQIPTDQYDLIMDAVITENGVTVVTKNKQSS